MTPYASRSIGAPPTAGRPDPGLLDPIIRRSPIGIAVIDFAGLYRGVNPAYAAIYGYREDELLGRSFTLVFPAAERERLLALHQAFLTEGGDLRGEWDVVSRDGACLSVISESVRFRLADGGAARLVYVLDITERRRVETALRSSQHFAQSVLDALAAHVCVLDDAGVVVAVNRAWRDFGALNGGQADLVAEGTDYLVACEQAQHPLAPDGAEAGLFLERLREVLSGRLHGFELEYACHSPGERRWFVARVSRIEGSDPPRIVVTHDNVTALKLAQETLRREQDLLLDMAASLPGAMVRMITRVDGDWQIVYSSPGIEALFGIDAARACTDKQALRRCIMPDDKRAHDLAMRAAIERRRTWEHEYRINATDGQVKWIHVRAQPKPGQDGDLVWTGVITDISERKRIEAVLRESEETYRTLFETVPQGVVYHDLEGRITAANPAAQRILGLSLAQMQGRTSADPRWHSIREDGSIFPGDEHPAMQALRTGQPVKDVVMGLPLPGGDPVWILSSANPVFRNGQLREVYSSFEDITPRVVLGRKLRQQASTDDLTGAANRRSLMERLAIEFESVRRHGQRPCSVLAIDLDHFKQVNDNWGHAAGDAVLVHVTQLMRQETRSADVVGRTGGEEFTLLLPDTGPDDALALGERLRQRVETTPLAFDGHTISITASIGVSVIAPSDADPDAVLLRADRALYAAKDAGRNAVRPAAAQAA